VTEIGASVRAVAKTKATLTLSPADPLAKAHQNTARVTN
jgi:hypothetical protein